MKKGTILLALLTVLFAATAAYADSGISVVANGQNVNFADQQPIMIDGRTLVPVRGVFEMLGFNVDWEYETSTAVLASENHVVRITVGQSVFYTNGVAHQLDVPAQIIGGRTMVPLRLPLESVGYFLGWDGTNQTVLISTEFIDDVSVDAPLIASPTTSPQPVVLTEEWISDSQFIDWLVYYFYTGGMSEIEWDVIQYINEERAAVGAPPLEFCRRLTMAARFKSQEMVDLGYFHHESPVYGNFRTIPMMLFDAHNMISENLSRRVVRENIARTLVDGWMESPGHRENMLNPHHRVVGAGVVTAMGVGVNFDGTPITDRYASMGTAMFAPIPHESLWMYAENLFPPSCEVCEWYGPQITRMAQDPTSLVLRYTVPYFGNVIFIDYEYRHDFEGALVNLEDFIADERALEALTLWVESHSDEYFVNLIENIAPRSADADEYFVYLMEYHIGQLMVRGMQDNAAHIFPIPLDPSQIGIRPDLITPVGSEFYNLLNAKAIDFTAYFQR
ncbi:MAG: stalk domain-containing protein [Defluviitaleaceae bacterium]|nr:stalk domain-containing protein [Defluviitaleaceae bacterium]